MTTVTELEHLPRWAPERRKAQQADEATAGWLLAYASKRTREEYGADLRAWRRWCIAVEVDALEAKRGHVDAYTREIETRYAPASVKRKLASLSSWYRALVDAGIIDRNPVEAVRRPHVDPLEGSTPAATDEQVQALVEAGAYVGRDALALVRLLTEHGLRISEACGVQASDVARLPSGAVSVRIRRKGGSVDTRPVSDVLGALLVELAGERGHEQGRTLLRSLSGADLERSGGRRMLLAGVRVAGVEHVHPHMLRAWAITTALDTPNVQLHDAQRFAGHRSAAVTIRYDRNRDRRAGVIAGALLAAMERGKVPGGFEPTGRGDLPTSTAPSSNGAGGRIPARAGTMRAADAGTVRVT